MVEIKEGALFIADAHYPYQGDLFVTLLRRIQNGEVRTPQLFLMGDNFDMLFGYNRYVLSFSNEAVALLQELSSSVEVIYLEGNHDFCLKPLFPKITTYSREQQPIVCRLGSKKVAMAHGDKYTMGWGYALYTKILRCRLILPFVRPIINMLHQKLPLKEVCREYIGFEKRVEAIVSEYNQAGFGEVDWIIEGHYHQGRRFERYIALPALACQRQVGVIESGELVFKAL